MEENARDLNDLRFEWEWGSAPAALRPVEMILDLKWPWIAWARFLDALLDEDPMAPDYEVLESVEPTSQYADSRESAEAPAVQ